MYFSVNAVKTIWDEHQNCSSATQLGLVCLIDCYIGACAVEFYSACAAGERERCIPIS
jgi:hypothetical protein